MEWVAACPSLFGEKEEADGTGKAGSEASAALRCAALRASPELRVGA